MSDSDQWHRNCWARVDRTGDVPRNLLRLLAWVALGLLATTARGEDSLATGPRFIGPAPGFVRVQLTSYLDLALERLAVSPACGEMFAPFAVDPAELIGSALFRSVAGESERAFCRRNQAAAFTVPGGRLTYVCPDALREMPRRKGAILVLHEALHHAGLGESPLDPSAPSSREIDRLVRRHCGL